MILLFSIVDVIGTSQLHYKQIAFLIKGRKPLEKKTPNLERSILKCIRKDLRKPTSIFIKLDKGYFRLSQSFYLQPLNHCHQSSFDLKLVNPNGNFSKTKLEMKIHSNHSYETGTLLLKPAIFVGWASFIFVSKPKEQE
jgi:hypothetical protein